MSNKMLCELVAFVKGTQFDLTVHSIWTFKGMLFHNAPDELNSCFLFVIFRNSCNRQVADLLVYRTSHLLYRLLVKRYFNLDVMSEIFGCRFVCRNRYILDIACYHLCKALYKQSLPSNLSDIIVRNILECIGKHSFSYECK